MHLLHLSAAELPETDPVNSTPSMVTAGTTSQVFQPSILGERHLLATLDVLTTTASCKDGTLAIDSCLADGVHIVVADSELSFIAAMGTLIQSQAEVATKAANAVMYGSSPATSAAGSQQHSLGGVDAVKGEFGGVQLQSLVQSRHTSGSFAGAGAWDMLRTFQAEDMQGVASDGGRSTSQSTEFATRGGFNREEITSRLGLCAVSDIHAALMDQLQRASEVC
jgi:hypothetical protein